jgi:Rieske Fe-S protein
VTRSTTRRSALAGAAIVGMAIPALAGYEIGRAANEDGAAPGTSGVPDAPADDSPEPSSNSGPQARVLARTADIEVGGAVFLTGPVAAQIAAVGIVVTQPVKGQYHAFDRTCSHQRCAVSEIVDGKIHCPCHGSEYSMTSGENVGGPAPFPLNPVGITVEDGTISLA